MPSSMATGHPLASRPTFLLLVHLELINRHHLINLIHPMPTRLVLPVLRARHPLALPTIHIPSHLMPLPNNLCPVRARRKMHIRPVRVLQWRSRQP